MDYCRLHEENLVKKYHSQVRFDTNQWNGKIQALEIDIEKEGQRSERVEKQLCVNIEVNYRYLLLARRKICIRIFYFYFKMIIINESFCCTVLILHAK